MAFFLLLPATRNVSKQAPSVSEIRTLYAQGNWAAVVRLTVPRPGDPADVDYYRGMALAKLKRWTEAKRAFERGRRKAPRDKRFPTELAGVAFLQKDYSEAKRDLHRALRLDPRDDYAANFLATIYELEGNLDAALKYWNRVGKPEIRNISMNPSPETDPVLLDRAFAFAPDSLLTRSAFRATGMRLNGLGIFGHPELELQPLASGDFDVQFISNEKNGWGDGALQSLLSIFRGVPYYTAYPSYFNIRHSAMNFNSLLRWDPNKERVFASFSSPLAGSATRRFEVYLDGRRENWNLTNSFFGAPAPVTDMHLEKVEGGADIESIVGTRFAWSAGADFSGRSFSNVSPVNSSAAQFFRNGFAMEYRAAAHGLVLDIPERRLTLESGAAAQLGKFYARGSGAFLRAEGTALARWFPRAQGDDYAMTLQARVGETWGAEPFDELFTLGLERDNDLWLRGHIGTENGKKGSSPLGRNYALFNWDDFKNVYGNGFFNIKLGPFLDSGRITDPSADFGSRQWLVDTGLELKVQVLGGATVEFFFGKNLRAGANAFYATAANPVMSDQ